MRKIAVITGTRAEYGILKPVLEKILASKKLELSLIVTGMHLMPEYGFTVREIEKDGIPIAARLEMILSSDEMAAMGKSLGIGITGLIQELEHIHPDVVLVLGDRIEAFAGATAGLFQGAVVAHIHGGETTEGGLDEYMRHAITKISHIHFPATPLSRKRILDMGENPDFVYCVGTPGLDALLQFPKYTSRVLENKLGVKIPTKFALFIQHPISTHPKTAAKEIKESLAVLDEQNLPTFAIYPNADAGSRDSGASSDEIALAGRGFSEQVEREYEEQESLDFGPVDEMEGLLVPVSELGEFLGAIGAEIGPEAE